MRPTLDQQIAAVKRQRSADPMTTAKGCAVIWMLVMMVWTMAAMVFAVIALARLAF